MKELLRTHFNVVLLTMMASVMLSCGVAFGQAASVKKGIVKIKSYSQKGGSVSQIGTGSCFYISENNILYILTANHVVFEGGLPLRHFVVSFDGNDRDFEAKIYRSYQGIDVAVLALEDYPRDVAILELGTSKDVKDFEVVFGYGYPGGGIIRGFEGTVSAPSEGKIYVNNIDLQSGNSGGPLLSKRTNKIVGIILQKASDAANQHAIEIDFSVLYLRSDHVLKKVFSNNVSSMLVDDDDGKSVVNALTNANNSEVNYGEIIYNSQDQSWHEYINGVFHKSYTETGRDQIFIYIQNVQSPDETYAIPHYGGTIQFRNYSTNNTWSALLHADLSYRNVESTHFLVTSDGRNWYNYENGIFVKTYQYSSRDQNYIQVVRADGLETIALPIKGGVSQISNSDTGNQWAPLANFQNTVVSYSYRY